MNQLSENERESLNNGSYTLELYEQAIEEIKEIEAAIMWRFFKEEPEQRIELEGDFMADIAIMSEVFN